MPSGSKKRKAAKKKKGNHTNDNPAPSHVHGGEEGEPTLNPPQGGKIEVVEDESAIPIQREFKNDDGSNEETSRKSYDGGSSGSSSSRSNSSSSDDDSDGIKSGNEAIVDTAPHVDSVKVVDSLSNKKIEAVHSATIEEAAGDSAAGPCTGEAITQSVVAKECVAEETDDQLAMSTNAPVATTDNGASTEKDSGVTQPLLAPAPPPVQTTTWKSCCGLFEVFTGDSAR